MTKNEARDILECYQLWRRGEADDIPDARSVGIAIDAAIIALGDSESLDLTIAYQSGFFNGKRSKSSIAQSIRYAALNNVQLFGVEHHIFNAFAFWYEDTNKRTDQMRTFMLLVAEALE